MPEVPTLVPSPLEGGENLDLHEVPTKAPIASNVVADDGQDAQLGYLRQRKGYTVSVLAKGHEARTLLQTLTYPTLNPKDTNKKENPCSGRLSFML